MRDTAVTTELVEQAKRFDGLALPPELARKFMLLRLSLTAPAPKDAALRREMTTIGVSLDADYGKGKYCRKNGECLDITAIEKLMATSRDPEELKKSGWAGTRLRRPCGKRYARFVDLSNQGAREMGFKDTGALWRSSYDMPPEEFRAELERLWKQVRPLYLSLHTYVRWKLRGKIRHQRSSARRPDPRPSARQSLGAGVGEHLRPARRCRKTEPGYDLTELLKSENTDAKGMVQIRRRLLHVAGLRAPAARLSGSGRCSPSRADRDVVCHASAWDVDNMDDLRVKMCIQIRGEDFVTIHHELGHNFYQRAYKDQPFLFREWRQRRIPRGHRRLHRALHHARIPA